MNDKKIISSINMNNCNNLIRGILSGVTNEELEQLVKIRKSIKTSIPTPRHSLDQSILRVQRKSVLQPAIWASSS